MLACATGRHISLATLTCRKAGGFEFLKIKLSDILVSSYELGAHLVDQGFSVLGGHEDSPSDRMSLNFVKIDFLYTVQRTGEMVDTTFSQNPT
jgi:type VI protein secretion system component Hcp